MSRPEVATIIEDGKAYTGVVTGVNTHAGLDMFCAFVTMGLSDALGGRSEPTVTVEVNGKEHSGSQVK